VRKRVLRFAVGALLGGLGLWLSLRDIPLNALDDALLSADPFWALSALAATLVAVGAIVARWRILLLPAHADVSVLARSTIVGQMLNIVLPFRVGEVARIYAVARHSQLGITRVTASLAIEKALDLAIFGIVSATLITTALLPRDMVRAGRVFVGPVITIAALSLMVLAVRWRIGHRVAAWFARRRHRVAARIARVLDDVSDGLDAWRSAGHAASVLAWTLVIFTLAATGNQLLFRAFALDVPLSAGFALLVALQAGSVPPSLPGRLGIYNYVTVLTLALYGVSRRDAATVSIALYAIAYAPKVVLGAIIAADPSWRPSWTGNDRG
jgi:uncharacterized protein (TIRG00374 family)